MPSTDAATMFLTTLNGLHPSFTFTMELPVNGRISFTGIEMIKNGTQLETQVHRKSTNTGLLLHFQSHTVKHYKESLSQHEILNLHIFISSVKIRKCETFSLRTNLAIHKGP